MGEVHPYLIFNVQEFAAVDERRPLAHDLDDIGGGLVVHGMIQELRGGTQVHARAPIEARAPGLELRTCSVEDLMVMKRFASRAIAIRDAEGIAVRHEKTLDWGYVEEQLTPLAEAKEEPEILGQLARMRRLGSTL